MKPRASIVMACYNAAAHLQTSIGSILAQTLQDWELLVVDDGSTDSSWRILQTLALQDPRIQIFQQANAGASASRNRALREAQGTYIAFLDSDDTWHAEFLEVMASALDTNPDAGIAYCGWQNIGLGGGRDEPFIPPDYENELKIESLLGGCRWPIHGALVRSPIIRDAGGFDESLSSCMDYDLWLRIGTHHRLVRVPRVLAYYQHHGGEQITHDRARIALNHWHAQQKFLQANPAVTGSLGKHRISQLTTGELTRRGYESYWRRDLAAARKIFRVVMKQGYGNFNDWTHMLPAWLPESWHRWLLSHRDHANHTAA